MTTTTAAPKLDTAAVQQFVDAKWDTEIIPKLSEYIEIPNQSPSFDPEWATNGHMDRAMALLFAWVQQQLPTLAAGSTAEVVRLPGRTPLMLIEVPATGGNQAALLMYGHMDKQPPLAAADWKEGFGPYKAVIADGRLWGRGGADDGYSVFAALTALQALQRQAVPHGRVVVVIEACEESGSPDLPHYIEHLAARIGGDISLVVCLDSGCGNYDQFWLTSSLRGLVTGNLRVDIEREGVHSGSASGIVPSTFRILRQLLDRLEDVGTGRILPAAFSQQIPAERVDQARETGRIMGATVFDEFPFLDGARPVTDDITELILNRTWRPQLEITGAEGLPTLAAAGNVLRPYTTVKLSLRLPPEVDPKAASAALKQLLEASPPYGARVAFEGEKSSPGWAAPPTAPWLADALAAASHAYFGKPAAFLGEGGSIPFMGMLGKRYPKADFVITGLLGPGNNAHGPNENLHIATGKRVTACVASIIAAHHAAAPAKPQ